MQRADAVRVVVDAVTDALRAQHGRVPDDIKLSEDTRLLGQGGVLDSNALVSVVIDVEDRLAEEFGARVSLADETAMSATRSPFRGGT